MNLKSPLTIIILLISSKIVLATGIGPPDLGLLIPIFLLLMVLAPIVLIAYVYHVFTKDNDDDKNNKSNQDEDIDV